MQIQPQLKRRRLDAPVPFRKPLRTAVAMRMSAMIADLALPSLSYLSDVSDDDDSTSQASSMAPTSRHSRQRTGILKKRGSTRKQHRYTYDCN